MTIEEKAKAYDEAMERARKSLRAASNDGTDIVTFIFPQLAESDDERIRKQLVDIVAFIPGANFQSASREDCRAYLEKQKEPHYSPLCNTIKDKIREYIANHFITDTVVKTDVKSIVKAMEEGVRLGKEEQKPVEWDEIQEEFRNINEAFEDGKKEVTANPEKYGLCKPAEWSEEDEENFKWFDKFFRAESILIGGKDIPIDKYLWFKSLRPQPKQERQIKEGNKVKIHCRKDRAKDMLSIYNDKVGEVIDVWDAKRNPWGHIGVRLDNGCNNCFYEDELEVLNEPHWKPSKEQMEALASGVNYLAEHTCTPGNLLLISLYHDIKNYFSL